MCVVVKSGFLATSPRCIFLCFVCFFFFFSDHSNIPYLRISWHPNLLNCLVIFGGQQVNTPFQFNLIVFIVVAVVVVVIVIFLCSRKFSRGILALRRNSYLKIQGNLKYSSLPRQEITKDEKINHRGTMMVNIDYKRHT